MGRRPYFPFYAPDWLSAPEIALMTPAQEGAYIHLLALCWKDDDCSLPADYDDLSTLSRLTNRLKPSLRKVLDCFQPHPIKEGRLTHPRLWDIFVELEKTSRNASERGRKGAAKRWGVPSASNARPVANDGYSDTDTDTYKSAARDPSTATTVTDCKQLEQSRRTTEPEPPPYKQEQPCTECDSGPMTLRPSKFTNGSGWYYKCLVCDTSVDATAWAKRWAKNKRPKVQGPLRPQPASCPQCGRPRAKGEALCVECLEAART